MKSLDILFAKTTEPLTIVVDERKKKMSITVGENAEKQSLRHRDYSDEDLETLKGHASKVWGTKGIYTYVVYPKKAQ